MSQSCTTQCPSLETDQDVPLKPVRQDIMDDGVVGLYRESVRILTGDCARFRAWRVKAQGSPGDEGTISYL